MEKLIHVFPSGASSYVYQWKRDYLVTPWYFRNKTNDESTGEFGYFHGYDPINDQLSRVDLEMDRHNTYQYSAEFEGAILLCNDGTTFAVAARRKGDSHYFLHYASHSGNAWHDDVDGFSACALFFPCRDDETYCSLDLYETMTRLHCDLKEDNFARAGWDCSRKGDRLPSVEDCFPTV